MTPRIVLMQPARFGAPRIGRDVATLMEFALVDGDDRGRPDAVDRALTAPPGGSMATRPALARIRRLRMRAPASTPGLSAHLDRSRFPVVKPEATRPSRPVPSGAPDGQLTAPEPEERALRHGVDLPPKSPAAVTCAQPGETGR